MNPVVYPADIKTLVDAYNARPADQKSAAYWSDPEITPVRKVIKDHYITEQAYCCAYCRHQIVSNNNAVWDGEHIISKAKNPEFMFEPRNLAVACKDCNGAKGEQEVRSTQKKSFPEKTEDYVIAHPHFDSYDDHVGWIGEICFAKTTGKGAKTIAMCNLSRYAALTVGEKANIMDKRFNGLVAALLVAQTPDDAEIVLAGVKQLLVLKQE